MSFKKAFSALVFSVLTAFLLGFECFAESSSQDEEPGFSSDMSPVTRSYDEESMMFFYTFSDGASFYASENVTDGENSASVLLVGSEEDDILILVNGANGSLEQSNEYFITEIGAYEVTISHILRDGSEPVQARFAVEIGEQPAETEEKMITGRVVLESIDGESFRHTFINGTEFVTNVLDGETVSFIPKLSIPDSAICSMTRDGNVFSMPSSGLITEDGAYKMEISCFNDEGKMEKRFFSFNLFTSATNRLGILQPPYGFELSEVKLNGESVPLENKNFTVLNGEGDFSVKYTNGELTRSVILSRDTTPPVLYFNGTTDVVFSERITLTSDTECTFRVTKNGQILGNVTELLGAGIYRITAADKAGNITSARVEIKAISAINPLDFIIIFGVLLIGGLVYFFIQKNRKMTVR